MNTVILTSREVFVKIAHIEFAQGNNVVVCHTGVLWSFTYQCCKYGLQV